jgi:hypothetical protein
MVKLRGERLKIGEAKVAIITYILENPGPVSEPNIRKYLKEKYDIQDQGTIHKHISQLKDTNCIEPSEPPIKSRANYWNITKTKHLEPIIKEYPVIPFNEYEKVLNILSKKLRLNPDNLADLKIYIRLRLSRAFSILCLENDTVTLFSRTWTFYKHNRGFPFRPIIDDHQARYLAENKDTEKENLINFQTVHESFFKILNELPDYISNSDFHRLIDAPAKEKVNKLPYNDDTKKFLQELLTEYTSTVRYGYLLLLSDNFSFYQDVLNDTASPDEIDFMEKTSGYLVSALDMMRSKIGNEKKQSALEEWHLKDFKLISKVIYDKKTPSSFGIFNNSDEVFEFLKKKYENEYKNEYADELEEDEYEPIELTKDGEVPLMKYNVETGKMESIYKD